MYKTIALLFTLLFVLFGCSAGLVSDETMEKNIINNGWQKNPQYHGYTKENTSLVNIEGIGTLDFSADSGYAELSFELPEERISYGASDG